MGYILTDRYLSFFSLPSSNMGSRHTPCQPSGSSSAGSSTPSASGRSSDKSSAPFSSTNTSSLSLLLRQRRTFSSEDYALCILENSRRVVEPSNRHFPLSLQSLPVHEEIAKRNWNHARKFVETTLNKYGITWRLISCFDRRPLYSPDALTGNPTVLVLVSPSDSASHFGPCAHEINVEFTKNDYPCSIDPRRSSSESGHQPDSACRRRNHQSLDRAKTADLDRPARRNGPEVDGLDSRTSRALPSSCPASHYLSWRVGLLRITVARQNETNLNHMRDI
jgi:hypothetical protein